MSFVPTIARFLDLPALRKRDEGVQGFYIAACGISPAWRGCVVGKSLDGGQSWEALATVRTAAVMGRIIATDTPPATTVYPDGAPIFSITVRTTHAGQQLEGHAKNTVDQGANRLAISTATGLEVVSFMHAQLIGLHTYRLSSITRECKSTQRQTLAIGQAITHLAPGSLARVDMLNTQRGAPALYRVASFGQVVDDEPVLGFEELC